MTGKIELLCGKCLCVIDISKDDTGDIICPACGNVIKGVTKVK